MAYLDYNILCCGEECLEATGYLGEEMREKWPLRLVADIKHCLVGKPNIPQSIIVLY